MKNGMTYERPEFHFEELELSERVADTCWGYHYGWYDIDGDGVHDPNEEMIRLDTMGSCNSVADGLVGYLKDHFDLDIDRKDVHENSHSAIVRPVES